MDSTEQSGGQDKPIGIIGIEGRNGSDSHFLIPDNQCIEAYNVDWYQASLGRKRGGSLNLALTTAATAFATGTAALARFVPGFDPTLAEFWALDFGFNFHRLAASTSWVSPTVVDACTATPQEAVALTFNGKQYWAYKNAHNRLHVWDPATLTLRRTGLDLPAVPTIVLAGGAITATRKWRVAWTKQVTGVTTYRSNLGTATAATAMAAQQATLTQPAPPGEGETHWELYAAVSPYADYRLQGTAAIATTTIVDNAALGSDVAPAEGENTPPPSCRFIVADDSRIIMAGAYETAAENAATPSVRRVWWTSAPGSGTGDDERVDISISSYADLEEAPTGISQPLQVVTSSATSLERGSFYVFSWGSKWKFIATGDVAAPYLKFRIAGDGGSVHHKSIVNAIDINGNPAIYWWSESGPFRICSDGQQYLGEDIIDIIPTVNLDATIPCHTVYHRLLRQVWFYVATGTSLYPDTKLVFDTSLGKVTDNGVRLGWSVHAGEAAKAYCSCMFSDTVAASMGRSLKPYIGYTGANKIWKCDTTDANDDGNKFQAYIDSKSYAPWGLGRRGGMNGEAVVVADPSQGVTISLKVLFGEGADVNLSTADLTDHSDSQSADKVFAKFEGSKLADSMSFRCRIGDVQATDNAWSLDALIVPVSYQGGN